MIKEWVVYLLRCSDGSLYCGITNNLKNRMAAHGKGQGAKYTRSRIPIELVGISSKMGKSDALKLEYRVKRMPAGEKIFELSKTEDILATDFKSALKELKNEFRKLGKQVEGIVS
jgi:putative endonuclease